MRRQHPALQPVLDRTGTVRRIARCILTGVLALGGILVADTALAQCSVSATPVSFGTYNVFAAAPNDSTGEVTVTCNRLGGTVRISLSKGSSATFSPRTIASAARVLNYNLYVDAARTAIWGDGTGGTTTHSQTVKDAGGTVQTPIYGRIFARQDVPVGQYTDTVVVTINF